MLALCLMLSGTYYAKNYAGIIGRGLHPSGTIWTVMNLQSQKNAACESRPGYLNPVIDMSG